MDYSFLITKYVVFSFNSNINYIFIIVIILYKLYHNYPMIVYSFCIFYDYKITSKPSYTKSLVKYPYYNLYKININVEIYKLVTLAYSILGVNFEYLKSPSSNLNSIALTSFKYST